MPLSRLIAMALTVLGMVGTMAILLGAEFPQELNAVLIAGLGAAVAYDRNHGHNSPVIRFPLRFSTTPTHLVIRTSRMWTAAERAKKRSEEPAEASVSDWGYPGCTHSNLTPVRTPEGEIVNWLCADPRCCKALSLPEARLGFDVVLPANYSDDIYPLEAIVASSAEIVDELVNVVNSMFKNKAESLGPNYCNQHDDDVRECCGFGTTKPPHCARCGHVPSHCQCGAPLKLRHRL